MNKIVKAGVDLPQQVNLVLPDTTLPDPDMVTYYVLENDRKIYLDLPVADASVLAIQKMILRWNMDDLGRDKEQRKPIMLYIFSYGGSMDYMWSLIDTIKVSDTPVYTINMGIAASAASLIYLAGHKRYMLPRSQLIIHEGSAEMAGDAVKVFDSIDNYKEMVKKMKEFILQHSKIPQTMLNKKRNNDWYIDANYCFNNGACDKIIESISEII